MLILLWGIPSEGPLRAVREELDRLGAATYLVDQRAVLDAEVELEVAAEVRGTLRTADTAIDLAQVTACYMRPYDWRELPAVTLAGAGSGEWHHAADVQESLSCWSEVTPALVVNRLSAMAANGSKPYQLVRISECGFRVPETVLTTDPAVVRAFWDRHGSVIYKSVSAIRSRVSRLTKEHLERLGDIAYCPTQFQQYIAGTDYRVHVVGDEIFCCAIKSEADDYRYPGESKVDLHACQLPREVEEQCRRMAASMDLHVAGIDLRRGQSDGEWYCFEVNPSPGFTYYEDATGLPIGSSIARLLAGGAGETGKSIRNIEVNHGTDTQYLRLPGA